MAARVGIVVVHYGRKDLTERCVASVEAGTYKDFRIEVVNNNEINRGFAGGANAGIRAVLQNPEVKYILVLNNDVFIAPEALMEMMKTAENEGVDMVAPVVRKKSSGQIESLGLKINFAWLGFNRKNSQDGELLCPSGCAALYSRRLIEDISVRGQFFDEDFFMYGEDTDVGLRARGQGYHCALAEDAVVYHEGSASAVDSSLPMYLGHRNNVWYIAKNISLVNWHQWPTISAEQIVSLAWLTLRGDGKIIWKAKYDAMKGLSKMVRKRSHPLGLKRPLPLRQGEKKLSDRES